MSFISRSFPRSFLYFAATTPALATPPSLTLLEFQVSFGRETSFITHHCAPTSAPSRYCKPPSAEKDGGIFRRKRRSMDVAESLRQRIVLPQKRNSYSTQSLPTGRALHISCRRSQQISSPCEGNKKHTLSHEHVSFMRVIKTVTGFKICIHGTQNPPKAPGSRPPLRHPLLCTG